MFVLKELENSDARCGCVTCNFADLKAAQNNMREQFEKTKKLLHGEFDKEENEKLPSELQRWASISPMSAHIQEGLDAYDWEIVEDSDWVNKNDGPNGFVVTGSTINGSNGDIIPVVPVFAATEEEAREVLKKMYLHELENLGLEDNDACDENDDSCPGGCLTDCEADIWNYTEHTFDSLVNVAHFSYFPLAGQKGDSV